MRRSDSPAGYKQAVAKGLLYISYTRAMHRLTLLHTGKLYRFLPQNNKRRSEWGHTSADRNMNTMLFSGQRDISRDSLPGDDTAMEFY
jgi:hypothetical protein